jgi:hypothetical protein
VKGWPVVFRMNKKGVMDDDEFEKFTLNSIIPIYPNAKDKGGAHHQQGGQWPYADKLEAHFQVENAWLHTVSLHPK